MYGDESSWSLDFIKDETVRTKFITLPATIAQWVEKRCSVRGAEILDFGCGEGIT